MVATTYKEAGIVEEKSFNEINAVCNGKLQTLERRSDGKVKLICSEKLTTVELIAVNNLTNRIFVEV